MEMFAVASTWKRPLKYRYERTTIAAKAASRKTTNRNPLLHEM